MATANITTKHGDLPRDATGSRTPWAVWPLWFAACAVGNALAALSISSVGKVVDAPAALQPLKMAAGPAACLVVLLLPALFQWLILRQWFARAGWWIPASGVGWLLGLAALSWGIAVADTQGETPFARVAVPAAFLVPGVIAGTAQWLVLRRNVAHAAWWILASGSGWAAGQWAFMSLAGTGQGRYFEGGALNQALAGAASGVASGAITGLALVLLLQASGKQSARGSLS